MKRKVSLLVAIVLGFVASIVGVTPAQAFTPFPYDTGPNQMCFYRGWIYSGTQKVPYSKIICISGTYPKYPACFGPNVWPEFGYEVGAMVNNTASHWNLYRGLNCTGGTYHYNPYSFNIFDGTGIKNNLISFARMG